MPMVRPVYTILLVRILLDRQIANALEIDGLEVLHLQPGRDHSIYQQVLGGRRLGAG